jgi:hypothetical protein
MALHYSKGDTQYTLEYTLAGTGMAGEVRRHDFKLRARIADHM